MSENKSRREVYHNQHLTFSSFSSLMNAFSPLALHTHTALY